MMTFGIGYKIKGSFLVLFFNRPELSLKYLSQKSSYNSNFNSFIMYTNSE